MSVPASRPPSKVSILRHLFKNCLFRGTRLLYDFIDDFAHHIAELPDEDAVQHYRRLPERAAPKLLTVCTFPCLMVRAIPSAKREGWHLKQMRNNDQEPRQRAGGKATNSFSRRGNRISAKKEGNPFGSPNRNCEKL